MRNSFLPPMQKTVADVLAFLKNPQEQPAENLHIAGKLRVLLKVMCIDIVLMFFFIMLFWGLEELGLLNSHSHAIDDLLKSVPIWQVLIAGVIIVPFVEELVFRYGLRFKIGVITLMLTILVIVAVSFGFYYLTLIGALLLMALLVSALVFYFTKIDIITPPLNHLWTRRYGIVFYFVALIFGLVHITNFTDFNYASAAILLVPVLVAPQFIGGLLIGYMRVKYGFFWGYYLHAGSYAIFFIIGIIFFSALEEKMNISNDNYTIKVEEYQRKSSNESMVKFVKNDSVSFINYNLNDVIHVLLDKDTSAIKFDGSAHKYTSINLNFKNSHQKQISRKVASLFLIICKSFISLMSPMILKKKIHG